MSMEEKEQIKSKIREAIEKNPDRDAIKRAMLFGSYAYGNPTSESDIDLVVELNPDIPVGLFKFARIQKTLGDFLGKTVDLCTPDSLSKYIRDEVLSLAQPIYEAR